MKYFNHLLLFLFLSISLSAQDIPALAKQLQLQPGTKASIQWKRVFSSQRHMKKYHVDKLPLQIREKLETYLISHAADSDQPIVPGL